MADECEHGRLRRACPECHAAEDIAELQARVAELEAEANDLGTRLGSALLERDRLKAALEGMVREFGYSKVHTGMVHDEHEAIRAAMDALR
jgi:hypothetical protein